MQKTTGGNFCRYQLSSKQSKTLVFSQVTWPHGSFETSPGAQPARRKLMGAGGGRYSWEFWLVRGGGGGPPGSPNPDPIFQTKTNFIFHTRFQSRSLRNYVTRDERKHRVYGKREISLASARLSDSIVRTY